MSVEVIELKAESDLCWSFEGDGRPFFRYQNANYESYEYVDPFPAYPHDAVLVSKKAHWVAQQFPIPQQVTFYLTDRETAGRTNGYTNIGYFYGNDEENKKWSASIVLSGKRIPILPAMTRYLVAHEYGHAVAKYLRWKYGYGMNEGTFYAEYAAKRGIECPEHYGGGTWHMRTEEIVANDFRVLMTGEEVEFWPHPVPYPDTEPEIVEMWKKWQFEALAEAMKEIAY